MTRKIILLIGPPCAGKGTQAKALGKKLMLPHFSTGDIFRKMTKIKTKESELLNDCMASGKLVPSDLVNRIVKKVLLSIEHKNGYILDGYPRNLEQAKYFIQNIDSEFISVFFEVSDETVIKRAINRYSCQSCGAIYNNLDYSETHILCNHCGSNELKLRSDDCKKIVLERIEEYKRETLPLINFYKNKNNFFIVNADGNKEEVSKEVALIVKRI